MNCSALDILFPVSSQKYMEAPITIVFNSIPTITSFVIFILFLLTRQPSKQIISNYILIPLSISSIAVADLLMWRMFEVLECKGDESFIPYKLLVIIFGPIVALLLLFITYYRNFYNSSTLLLLGISGCLIATDYFVRKTSVPEAAHTIFPAQTFVCIVAISSLFMGRYKYITICPISLNQDKHKTKHNENNNPFNPHFMDPTSRHPLESRGSESAPEHRSFWN